MKAYNKYLRRANKIVEGLKAKVKNNPSAMVEDYGQKEIQPIIDELNGIYSGLSYRESCEIKKVLYSVSDITI